MERLFFGYSAKPDLLRETLSKVAARARDLRQVASSISWEDLRVDGRLIINEIEQKIREATLCIFDLTTINNNVLFELGLSTGQGKRVVIVRDMDDHDAEKRWTNFSLLTTIGWTGYKNADHLLQEIDRISSEPGKPLWDDLMRGVEARIEETKLLYFPSTKKDGANQKLGRLLENYQKFDVNIVDLEDYGSMPLEWYAEQIYRSHVAIFHLTPARGYLAEIMNPRVSLLAGLARGLNREVSIAVEDGQETAIDYRDIAMRYSTAGQLHKLATSRLEGLRDPNRSNRRKPQRDLSNELASLRFGNHVAEHDQEGLERYFVETGDFRDIVSSVATIFTGRKGTGKTANMLQAAAQLRIDARNLVCVVKPVSYELESLLDVLRRLESRHLEDYLIEALWKYLIYTEIAARAVEEGESRAAGIASGGDLDRLRKCLDLNHLGVSASFSVRLERLVESLVSELSTLVNEQSIADARERINRALYGSSLRELRSLIGQALSSRNRVAVLVDNLDKAWEQGADLDLLSRLLLGLLGAVDRVVDEFQRENSMKARVNVTLTVFLRSDIYAYVRDRAREPDKIRAVEIEWRDRNLLARVLEDRFLAERPDGTPPDELWTSYFTEQIRGISSREHILSCVQARPRDLVFLANSAVSYAANAKHGKIDEDDIEAAVKAYSQFAYQALVVEGLASFPDLDTVLIEFAGESAIIEVSKLEEILHATGREGEVADSTVTMLRRLGFLGLETTDGNFDYGGTDGEMRKATVLAKKHQKATGRRSRFQIHPAYRAYLEIRQAPNTERC